MRWLNSHGRHFRTADEEFFFYNKKALESHNIIRSDKFMSSSVVAGGKEAI